MEALYAPLQPGYFRLLRILDSTGLKCSVRTHPRDNAPAYYALSYAWREGQDENLDNSVQNYEIEVDGQMLQVQKNLHDALRYLGPSIWEEGLSLWADFICINQEDVTERSEQVQSMGTIFEEAKQVLAWLGIPYNDEKVAQGIVLMHRLREYVDSNVLSDDFELQLRLHKPFFPEESACELVTAWQGISEMFNRTYWERTWIYQEATVPRVQFCCGSHQWNPSHLAAVDLFAIYYLQKPSFLLRETFNRAFELLEARFHWKEGSDHLHLVPRLSKLRATICSDPRDKVFATISRAVDVTPDRFPVDYSHGLAEVYIAVVQFSIKYWHGLEILGYVHHLPLDYWPPLKPSIPSWAPDWRIRTGIDPFNSLRGSIMPHQVVYDPCPNTVVDANITNLELGVRGFVFDSIVTILHDRRMDRDVCLNRNWDSLLREKGAHFTDESFNRTMVGDLRLEADNQAEHSSWERGDSADWSLLNTSQVDLGEDCYNRRDYMIVVIRQLQIHRRMGCTKGGHLAIFPEAALEGDIIAAFYGGHALYVLRPIASDDDHYQFVGECYVDEMMDGQAMELAAASNIQDRILTLV